MQSAAARRATALSATAAALAGGLAYATVAPASQLFGRVLLAPRRPAEVALTFDDGPNPAATPYLLDLLGRHGIRATFFLIGRYALAQPTLARRISAEGHALGNHTMTHPRLPLCSHARIVAELQDAQHAIEDTAGAPVRLFRPPHGYRTPHALRTARTLGLTTTTWNLIANDWKLPTSERIAHRVLSGVARLRHGSTATNVVLHDGSQTTPSADRLRTIAAAATVIDALTSQAAQQTRFVTLEAWLNEARIKVRL